MVPQRDVSGEHKLHGADWLQVISDWPDAQLRLRERWSRLDDSGLKDISGDRRQLVARLRDAYGLSEQEAERQVDDFVETHWGEMSAGSIDRGGRSTGGMPSAGGASAGTPSTSSTGPRGGRTSGTRTTTDTGARGHRPAGGRPD